MARITSYGGAVRAQHHQMALITSECVPFRGADPDGHDGGRAGECLGVRHGAGVKGFPRALLAM